MEASNQTERKDLYTQVERTRSFINTWFGVIVTILAVIVIFVVAALEGTREVRASNAESGLLLTTWRNQNQVNEGFPEPFVTIVQHRNKDFYFVVEERHSETNEILSWYFAYDGGIMYVFSDPRHYVLVSVTFIFSILVGIVNYNSTIDKGRNTESFKKTLLFYQRNKDKVKGYTHLLPKFCTYKNTEAYIQEKRNVIESANLEFDKYQKGFYVFEELEKWQQKRLKTIEKIEIVKLRATDLLYEAKYDGNRVRLLPISPEEHKENFIKKSLFTKLFTSFASGLVAGFGVILGNWVLGLVFGFTIIASAVGAFISAADYVTNVLKNRFIGKGELLSEFDGVKEDYKKVFLEEQKKEEAQNALDEKEEPREQKEEKLSIQLENAV